ncbi:MAG: hypothetical protein WKF73_18060 [Nocardioidaceae bacterium]
METTERRLRVEKILGVVYSSILTEHEPRWAVLIASERNVTATKQVSGQIAELAVQVTGRDEKSLVSLLNQLPATTHAAIRTAWEHEPVRTFQLAQLLTDRSPSPTSLLNAWAASPPAWIVTSTTYLTEAVAECAYAYGSGKFAAELLGSATAAGSPRSSYNNARVALIRHDKGDESALANLKSSMDSAASSHPLSDIAVAVLENDSESLAKCLDAWEPEDLTDLTIRSIIRFNLVVGSESEWSSSHFSRAIDILNDVIATTGTAALMLVRARVLVMRASQNLGSSQFLDLRQAKADALRARDIRRAFRGDSAEAVAQAYEIANILGESGEVINQHSPDNDYHASPDEINDSRVCAKICIAGLITGNDSFVSEYSQFVTDPFERSRIQAFLTEKAGSGAEDAWLTTLQNAGDESQRAQALSGLARSGATNLPGLDELSIKFPQLADEISASAIAAGGDPERAIERLRPHRRTSSTAAQSLAHLYERQGRAEDAAQTLHDAASDFSDPALDLESAFVRARASQNVRALTELDRLLASTPADWRGRVDCLGLAADLCIREEYFRRALDYLSAYLQIRPNDLATNWVYLRILVKTGEYQGETVLADSQDIPM